MSPHMTGVLYNLYDSCKVDSVEMAPHQKELWEALLGDVFALWNKVYGDDDIQLGDWRRTCFPNSDMLKSRHDVIMSNRLNDMSHCLECELFRIIPRKFKKKFSDPASIASKSSRGNSRRPNFCSLDFADLSTKKLNFFEFMILLKYYLQAENKEIWKNSFKTNRSNKRRI